ncbi:O-methyltransferase [Soehngenia longivitae]|uniref:tRNA 5-hydroxyuridine methyltransferase n=1 Tax=Soehngenia longivitae TaxID=2562294 RepID=A0A4Z0D728_9FIRM|nr:O-methyltransferase [Soehngenia longivitae]TFZ40686.1 O-methyltransferase [Soehngenia longivitae]
MSYIINDKVINYIQSLYSEESKFLNELRTYANINKIPILQKETAQLLKVLLKMIKPKEILEIGTAIGYSSILMAHSLNLQCKITTIELDPLLVDIAINNINNANLSNNIQVIEGDAISVLPLLTKKYDLIFIDANKSRYKEYFDMGKDMLNNGGVIISDNVLYKGMTAVDDSIHRRKRTIVKNMRNYLEYITTIDGYITSIIPIGDGVALTYKGD